MLDIFTMKMAGGECNWQKVHEMFALYSMLNAISRGFLAWFLSSF